VNHGQEFVIGGYTHRSQTFDARIFGYYEGGKLLYVARMRNGFTPTLRAQPLRELKTLAVGESRSRSRPEPFAVPGGATRVWSCAQDVGRRPHGYLH
jgi:ATP-dependent DNA ligase